MGILGNDFKNWKKALNKYKTNKILYNQFCKENNKFNCMRYQGGIIKLNNEIRIKSILNAVGKATTGEIWREFNLKYSPKCMKTIKRELDNLVLDGFLRSEPTQVGIRGRSTIYEVIKIGDLNGN